MQRLLQFLVKYRIFIFFLALEGLSVWVIVANNSYHGAKFFNSSNRASASLIATADNVGNYFDLRRQNIDLAKENARLRHLLSVQVDSAHLENMLLDSTHEAIKARVIDNSLFFRNNYMILNRGYRNGVEKGMGVIGPDGVVGQVQRASENYSTVISLLHGKSLISAKHGPSGSLCTVNWRGKDHLTAHVDYLPRHLEVSPGDSIFTSGFNSVYPEQTLIGIVSEIDVDEDATFYSVDIALATDFGSLSFVYLLKIKDKQEIDSLRSINQDDYE